MALIVNHLNKTKYLLNLLKRHYTVAATEPKILCKLSNMLKFKVKS